MQEIVFKLARSCNGKRAELCLVHEDCVEHQTVPATELVGWLMAYHEINYTISRDGPSRFLLVAHAGDAAQVMH